MGLATDVERRAVIEVLPMPADAGTNRLDHLAYMTKSAEQMRLYLGRARSDRGPIKVQHSSDGSAVVRCAGPGKQQSGIRVQPPTKILRRKIRRRCIR